MIARFPNFSPIQLNQLEEYVNLVSKFPPYSDFNFVSLFCWNKNDLTEISILGKGIVIKLKDYTSNKINYSFLSSNQDTQLEIMELFKEANCLTLVPEITVNMLNTKYFSIQEELDNFDYIYNLEKLIKLDGKIYKKKRNKVHKYSKDLLLHTKVNVITEITELFRQEVEGLLVQWCFENEFLAKDMEDEIDAIMTAVDNLNALNLFIVEIRLKGKLKGISINEKLPGDMAICHFEKTVGAHENIASYFVQQIAIILKTYNCNYVNWEQDLGIAGLRQLKQSYHPEYYLKKYNVINLSKM